MQAEAADQPSLTPLSPNCAPMVTQMAAITTCAPALTLRQMRAQLQRTGSNPNAG